MKQSGYRKLFIGVAFAILIPMTAAGAEERPSSPKSSGNIDIMKDMRITIGRSILPEGGDPQVLHDILKRGQMVIFDETTEEIPWLLSAGILVNASPEQIWRVVVGFAEYPEWLSSCHSTQATEIGKNIYEVTFTLGFRFLFVPLYVKYSIRQYNQPPRRIDWIGLGGTIEKTYGWGEIIPVEGGNTMFFYTCWAEPGSGLLKHFYKKYPFLDVGISISAGIVDVQNVKGRVEQLKGEEGAEGLGAKPSGEPKTNRKEELKIMELLTSRGPVLLFKKPEAGKPLAVSTWITIAAPPERVWADLVDYESQQYFMPMMNGIKVLEREDNKARVEYKDDINIVFFSSKIKYQLEHKHYEPERITWTNIKGDRYVLGGSWELFPLDDGKKTLATYRVNYDTRTLGYLPRLVLKAIPDGDLAINSYLSSIRARDMRDWIEAPAELRSELKEMKERERNLRWQEWKRQRKEQISRQGKGK
jgi:ribosome-associated toxin RatA of RatAB toxin-antitoxin module